MKKLQRSLLVLGLLMMGIYVGARIHQALLSGAEVRRFKERQAGQDSDQGNPELKTAAPDLSLWSEKRIRQYQASLAEHFAPALALLHIPRIQLDVPVLEGTDELTLNRGVGLIAGTANPGEIGNIGIAGHRDGFFRRLKDLNVGDVVEVETQNGTTNYVIDRIVIVGPSDVSVLAQRSVPSVTLVTCYPFYYVGSAPKRYIVEASKVEWPPTPADIRSQDSQALFSKQPDYGH